MATGDWNPKEADPEAAAQASGRSLFGNDGQAKPGPDMLGNKGGNYLVAAEGGGDGVASSLHPGQFGAFL